MKNILATVAIFVFAISAQAGKKKLQPPPASQPAWCVGNSTCQTHRVFIGSKLINQYYNWCNSEIVIFCDEKGTGEEGIALHAISPDGTWTSCYILTGTKEFGEATATPFFKGDKLVGFYIVGDKWIWNSFTTGPCR